MYHVECQTEVTEVNGPKELLAAIKQCHAAAERHTRFSYELDVDIRLSRQSPAGAGSCQSPVSCRCEATRPSCFVSPQYSDSMAHLPVMSSPRVQLPSTGFFPSALAKGHDTSLYGVHCAVCDAHASSRFDGVEIPRETVPCVNEVDDD